MPLQDMRVGSKRPAFTFKEPKTTSNRKTSGGGSIDLGGLLGGLLNRKGNRRAAEEDYQRQLNLMDKMAEMGAGYSTKGTLGSVDIDYDNKLITQQLSPELQAEYDALLARTGLSRGLVEEMRGDPVAMQQRLYEQQQELKAPEQARLRTQTMEGLQAKGMLGSTGGAELYGQVEESIARSQAQDYADAMMQAQNLLDMERARGSQDLSTALAMGGVQVPFIEAGTQQGAGIPVGNVSGVSLASANIANLMGIRQGQSRKSLWDALGMGTNQSSSKSTGSGLFDGILNNFL